MVEYIGGIIDRVQNLAGKLTNFCTFMEYGTEEYEKVIKSYRIDKSTLINFQLKIVEINNRKSHFLLDKSKIMC